MPELVRGTDLSPLARAEVLKVFVYRWTVENPNRERAWKGAKLHAPTMALVFDDEWLKDHAFWITKAGRLARNRQHAEPASLLLSL